MERMRRREWWILLILVAGTITALIGKNALFSEAACPRLVELILYIIAGISTAIALLYALSTRNDSPVAKIASIGILIAGILVITSVAGGILSNNPEAQQVYCPPDICEQAELATNLRENGKLDGAEDVARNCFESFPEVAEDAVCLKSCGNELALTLFEKAGQILDSLPDDWNAEKEAICQRARAQLDEAHSVAGRIEFTELARSIEERQLRIQDKCTREVVDATPTPAVDVELVRIQRGPDRSLIDVRILEGSQSVPLLDAEDFALNAVGRPIAFDFEFRHADDPVCLIAVVDDSGSIYAGLGQIRAALEKLSDLRKPGDELGLVLFAERDRVRVEQDPGSEPLDPKAVTGVGELTALWDGTLQGLVVAKSCTSSIRYLVVLTDGRDNDSRHLEGDNETKARQIAAMAADQGVEICTIGVRSDQLEPRPLELVAQGCGYYPAANFDVLASLLQDLFGYVRDFYRLNFASSDIPPEGVLTLEVLKVVEQSIEFPEQ